MTCVHNVPGHKKPGSHFQFVLFFRFSLILNDCLAGKEVLFFFPQKRVSRLPFRIINGCPWEKRPANMRFAVFSFCQKQVSEKNTDSA